MSAFKDHFSGVSAIYASSRPTYPDALFDVIAAHVPAGAQVWEPGCGSGQATRGLSARFAHVHATDPSAAQLARHWAHDLPGGNVTLAAEPAERPGLADASVDLVAVAQALHWFDRDAFFASCERVLRPGGVLAAWTYQDAVYDDDMAEAAEEVRDHIDPYWPPERNDVDLGYCGYHWPFEPLPSPHLWLTAQWTLPQLLGYVGSLSAAVGYRQATGRDVVEDFGPVLAKAWGDPATPRRMRWPLILHLRRKAD